jgi:hypothetical protein
MPSNIWGKPIPLLPSSATDGKHLHPFVAGSRPRGASFSGVRSRMRCYRTL